MSYTLDKQRLINGVVCDTADDVVKALLTIRTDGEDAFFKSLVDAINLADIDMICGHIDWFRAKKHHLGFQTKFGGRSMNGSERSSVEIFYENFVMNNKDPSDERAMKFIDEAIDLFC